MLSTAAPTFVSDPFFLKSFKRQGIQDIGWMLLFLLVTVSAVYIIPAIRFPVFLGMLIVMWQTLDTKAYFWILVLLIFTDSPALLFIHTEGTARFRLPLFSIGIGSISTPDLMALLFLIKGIVSKNKSKLYIFSKFRWLGLYFLLITIPISFVFNTDFGTFFNQIRYFLYFFLVFPIVHLTKDPRDVLRIIYPLVPIVLIVLMAQFYVVSTGQQVIGYIDPDLKDLVVKNSVSGEDRAIVYGELLVFLGFMLGALMMLQRKFELFPNFGIFMMITCYLAFLTSATRSWISFPLIFLIPVFFGDSRGLTSFVRIIWISIFGFISSVFLGVISIKYVEDNIFSRYFVSVDAISKGDLKDADTLTHRLQKEFPYAWEGVTHDYLFGVGMSPDLIQYRSPDVGFFNILILVGFCGFFLLLAVLIRFLLMVRRAWKTLAQNDFRHDCLKITYSGMIIVLLGILTIWDFFSLNASRFIFDALIFSFAEICLNHMVNEKKVIMSDQFILKQTFLERDQSLALT